MFRGGKLLRLRNDVTIAKVLGRSNGGIEVLKTVQV